MSKHVDRTGTEIMVGDFIVYSVTCGHSSALQFGLVKALRFEKDDPTRLAKLSCITVDKNWRGANWALQKKGGRVSIQVTQTMVLRPDTVLPEIRALLLGVP